VRIFVYATLEKPIRKPDSCAMARCESADRNDTTALLTSKLWRANLAFKQAGSGLCSTGILPVGSSDTGWKPLPLRAKEFVVDRIAQGRDGRRPSQKLPPTAIYRHFGAAKPLRSFQPLHSLLALEGKLASLTLVIAYGPMPLLGRRCYGDELNHVDRDRLRRAHHIAAVPERITQRDVRLEPHHDLCPLGLAKRMIGL
jgi:hypothetical protein